jgi:hypothetical protein
MDINNEHFVLQDTIVSHPLILFINSSLSRISLEIYVLHGTFENDSYTDNIGIIVFCVSR